MIFFSTMGFANTTLDRQNYYNMISGTLKFSNYQTHYSHIKYIAGTALYHTSTESICLEGLFPRNVRSNNIIYLMELINNILLYCNVIIIGTL